MASLMPKIKKLIKALELQGKIYLFSKSQVYSQRLYKICTLNKLETMLTRDEFFAKYPEKLKNKKRYKGELIKDVVAESFREIDILLKLVEIYSKKQGG